MMDGGGEEEDSHIKVTRGNGDSRRKLEIKPLRETNVSVAFEP